MRTLLLFLAGYIFSAIISCTNDGYTIETTYCVSGEKDTIYVIDNGALPPRIDTYKQTVPVFKCGGYQKINVCDFKIISKKELN